MWEPGGSSTSTTTTTGNNKRSTDTRSILLLLTFLIGCFLLYKAWGPLLFITCALVIVVHTCYSLLVNDSLLTPYTLVILKHAKNLILELTFTVKVLGIQGYRTAGEVVDYFVRIYNEYKRRQLREAADGAEEDMNGRNKNVYRLSTGELRDNTTPMNHDRYQLFAMNGACDGRTSTPLPRGGSFKKNFQLNGDLGLFTPINTPPLKKASPVRSENRQPSVSVPRIDNTHYSSKNTHWSNNMSPKMSDRPTVAKTVQTVAGPLLTSSRFNIDPKIYTDISSPGLTSRLTKYASEANAKLTHLPQYGTGQFPKVNLNASPKPLLSPKIIKSRTPVTVRVAPPEIVNYSPSDSHLHQEKSKIFPSTSTSDLRETQSCPSVVQVLKEISLKRHASREDIMLDLVKKQRFERTAENRLENFEEMMQKRGRDESASSDDLSPKSKTERPTKRSKSSSCHDVINSLSSSIHVLSGVKRKAMDTSRCATPEIEKHFKPSSRSPDSSSSLSLHLSSDTPKTKEQLNVKVPIPMKTKHSELQQSQEICSQIPNINKSSPQKPQTNSPSAFNQPTPKVHKEISVAPAPAKTASSKVTDKLFMKPEPQTNEKLKNLIEEQGNVGAKFTTDDKDEIKKQDIVNMRQNSMRLRLQNMFDAISGKSAHKIDPDVVIQAEEVNAPASSSSAFTSLNTLTTTTTVNTSPITTTIVPILKTDAESKSPIPKHVTFNLPSVTSSFSSISSSLTSGASVVSSKENTKVAETKPLDSSGIIGFGGAFKATTTSSAPSFNFGSNAAASSTTASTAATVSTTTAVNGFNFPSSTSVVSTAANSTSVSLPSLSIFGTTSASNLNTTITPSSTGFSFGNVAKNNVTATTCAPSANTFSISKSTEIHATSTNSTFTFGNPLSKSPASTLIAPTTSTISIFGGEKKEGGFTFGNAPSTSVTNATTISNQPTPTFGTPSTSSPMFSAGSNAAPIAATTVNQQPTFSFGAPAAATAAAASKPTFSFGATVSNTSTTTSSTPAFGSVSTVISGAAFGSGASTGSAFGSPAATLGNSAATTSAPAFSSSSTPSMFGAVANSSNLFSGSANSSSSTMFKSPVTTTASAPSIFASQSTPSFKSSPSTTAATTTPSIFGSQSSTPSFGATAAATTSTPSLFGNITTSSSMPSLFGNATATTTAANTPALPAFGSNTTQAPQGSIFSGVNANSGTPSIFGSTSSTPASGLFSGSANAASPTNQAPMSMPTDSTNIFGQTKPQATLTFGGSNAPTFGSNAPSTSFSAPSSSFSAPNSGSTSTFQLGSTPASTSGGLPSFNSIKPSTQFPSTQASTTTGGSIFGSSTSGSFNNASNAFGSSTSPFGGQSNPSTQPPAFGSTGQPSFGSTSTSPFSAPTTTTASTSMFGNTATAASTTAPTGGSSFSFGGTQTQQQPNASFSFGPSTSAPNPSGVFQFGGPSAAKPAGFNFNAPSAAPAINFTGGTGAPAFNAPSANMFSIGSGSSTPRPRASRQRRPR